MAAVLLPMTAPAALQARLGRLVVQVLGPGVKMDRNLADCAYQVKGIRGDQDLHSQSPEREVAAVGQGAVVVQGALAVLAAEVLAKAALVYGVQLLVQM